MQVVEVREGTRLEQLLKYKNIVSTGGEAKYLIQNGQVEVNGTIETRRGYTLKEGDVIKIGAISLKVSLQ